jgi:4-amino-4-deoxy-L-arabinose transferase-like glycosyltransferase
VSNRLIRYLESHRGSTAYLAAVTDAPTAAEIIVQTGQPVIAMGGYTGWDPAPTLPDFEQLVASGKLRYFYTEGYAGPTVADSVVRWVRSHGTLITPSAYGAVRSPWKLYDMSGFVIPGQSQPLAGH